MQSVKAKSTPAPKPEPAPEPVPVRRGIDDAHWDALVATMMRDMRIIDPNVPDPWAGARDLFDNPRCYGSMGPAVGRNGWPSYPQDTMGKRTPSVWLGRQVKWGRFRGHVDVEATRSMALCCPDSNVAIILGIAGVFALDIDCDDEVLAREVRACARRTLGGDDDAFVRYGRAPRMLMLYRTPPGVEVRSKPFKFASTEDPTRASDHAVEILGHQGSFTAFGRHHKTGMHFKWPGSTPFTHRPEDVPLVTEDQLRWFLREVQLVRPFVRGTVRGSQCTRADAADEVPYDPTLHGRLPRMPRDGAWMWQDGRVVDGRHSYIILLSLYLVTANGNAWRGPDGGERLIQEAADRLMKVLQPDARKSEAALIDEFRSTVRADIENLRAGRLHESNLILQPDGTLVKPGRLLEVTNRDPALDWLGQRDQSLGVVGKVGHANRGVTVVKQEPATDEKRAERALRTDRAHATAAVKEVTETAIDGFLGDVADERPTFRVLRAPTGGGKTVLTVSKGVLFQRDNMGALRPLLITLPTHRNAAEAVAVAKKAGALVHEPGGPPPEDAAALRLLNALKARGIRGVHWRSKLDAGCHRADEVQAMQDSGLGSDGICGPDPVAGEDEDAEGAPARCAYRAVCGFQRMKAEASRAHVIFAAHHWLTADRVPRQLADVSGVVIDESVTLAVLQAARVALSDMRAPRPVHLTKEERAAIKEAHSDDREREVRDAKRDALVADLLAARTRAVELLEKAGDPARAFATTAGALEDATVAERICRGAIRGGSAVTPDMSRDDVLALCAAHKPSPGAALEARVWATVREAARRFTDMGCAHVDREAQGPALHGHSGHRAFVGPIWPGPVDTRLQGVAETSEGVTTRFWRVSWRRETNWNDRPTLLLDATADEGLVRATFPHVTDDRFSWHRVDTDLNLRAVLVHGATFSPSSMVPPPDAEPALKKRAAETVVRAQRVISMVAGVHGHGRTLVGLPLKARTAVLGRFEKLPTLDSVHFGALRGLDAAKGHLAYVGVGRTEWPVWLLDGMVASATWDRCPQLPMDRLGTGVNAEGKPVRRKAEGRLARMRDGRDLWLTVPQAPTEWGRRLDAQWREAEQVQLMGRSRPVHRTDTAIYVHLSSVFPEGIVWDEVLSPHEMLDRRGHEVWETIVAAKGIVDESLTTPLMGKPAEGVKRVRDFVRSYRMSSGFRTMAWTDKACVRHEGLLAAWQEDPRAALEALGAPQECLDTFELGELREPLRPSVVLASDKVTEGFATDRDLDLMEADYQDFKEASPPEQDEGDAEHRARFRASWIRDDLETEPCSTYPSNSMRTASTPPPRPT